MEVLLRRLNKVEDNISELKLQVAGIRKMISSLEAKADSQRLDILFIQLFGSLVLTSAFLSFIAAKLIH